MSDFEDRVRRALRSDVAAVERERLLDAVHRGAVRRRRRRTGGAIAASVLIIAGAVGVANQVGGDEGASPEPLPATESPSPPQPTLPAGASRGVIDVSVASPEAVFKLTANDGCVACDTVWRQDASADGGWTRLHDFQARDAAALPFGPVTHLVMAENTRDGWAWGDRLFSTHDGGHTWTRVVVSPDADPDLGLSVHLTKDSAWALASSSQNGATLFRSPVLDDVWGTPPTMPRARDLTGATDLLTTDDVVAVEASGEGLSNPRLVVSKDDGASWSTLANPCPGENQVYPAETAAFVLCADHPTGEDGAASTATVYRTTDFTSWTVFGRSSGNVAAVRALADDRLLVVHVEDPSVEHPAQTGVLITPTGAQPVDLGLEPGEETGAASSSGGLTVVTTFGGTAGNRLVGSTDGGRTWHEVE